MDTGHKFHNYIYSMALSLDSLYSLRAVAICAATVSAVIITYFFVKLYFKTPQSGLSIPLSLPKQCHFLLGHANYLDANFLNIFGDICVDSATVDGLSCFYLLHLLTVNVIKAEHVKTVLLSTSYRSRVPLIQDHFDMFLGPKSITAVAGDEWKFYRRVMLKAFHFEYLQKMVGDMNKVALKFSNALINRSGGSIDIFSVTKCVTLDIIGMTAFGYSFNCVPSLQPSALANAFDFLLADITRRQFDQVLNPFSIFYSLPCEANRKLLASRKLVRGTLDEIIIKRRKDLSEIGSDRCNSLDVTKAHCDLLTFILQASGEDSAENISENSSGKSKSKPSALHMSDEALSDNLVTFLFGGYDTTSLTLGYAFYELSRYPDAEIQVLNEILSVLGPVGAPTYQQLMGSLPFCTAFLEEVLRLYPPAPLTVRNAEEQIILSRQSPDPPLIIPKGTQIYLPIWWIHRSPLNYEDPLVFKPERFLPENRDKIDRYAHIPFSGGGRDCVGRRFAMLEMLSVFTITVREIHFRSNPRFKLNPIKAGVVQRPSEIVELFITSRAQIAI